MILEFFLGAIVSIIAIFSFLSVKFMDTVNNWILITSKFIYYSGHPILDDDQIFEEITKRFKRVFISIALVIFKTLLFLVIILVLIVISSLFIAMIRDIKIPSFNSPEFKYFLFPKYLVQIPFILGTLIPIFIVPFMFKNKNRKKDTYSSIDKFLHYIFLGNKNVARFLFNFELWFNKKFLKKSETKKNVYISGLARAGTTVLMQYLGQLSDFKSLSYKNLPFLFLPRTGLKLISSKKTLETERFHQDGMIHSIDSYEALEEPFWRNYIGVNYILDTTIQKHKIGQKVFEKYRAFRKLVAGDNIYLAKNNNHLLRAGSLHELDKIKGNKTITIIPFRDPYSQAKSLLNQHVLLSKLQKEDEFTLDYMDFLVHHEFGLHAKQPIMNGNEYSKILSSKETIEYWLEIWYLYYNEVYKQFSGNENFYFFNYNYFATNPYASLVNLASILGVSINKIDAITINEFKPKNSNELKMIEEKYFLLYEKLELNALNYG